MTRVETLRRLAELRPLFARHHVARVALFGSAVRDAMEPGSDIDLLIDDARTPSLFELARLKLDLEAALGAEVDLVLRSALHPRLRDRIQAEAVDVWAGLGRPL